MAIGKVTVSRSFRPVINQEKCRRCGLCDSWCPDTACMLTDDEVIFDYRYCKGCGICANECPTGAIQMIRESEARGED